MSQVPGSHERVGLSSELPATERAHLEDKFKQMSGHKVQVNSRTVIQKFYYIKKKVSELHVRTGEIPDVIESSSICCGLWVFCFVLFGLFFLRADTAGYSILQINKSLEF